MRRTRLERWINLLGLAVLIGAGVLLARVLTRHPAPPPAADWPAQARALQHAIPAKLLQYRETGSIDTGIPHPIVMALGNAGLYGKGTQRIYAAGDGQLRVLDLFSSPCPSDYTLPLQGTPTSMEEKEWGPETVVGFADHVEVYKGSILQGSWKSEGTHSYITSLQHTAGMQIEADAGSRVVKLDFGNQHVTITGFDVPSPHFHAEIDPSAFHHIWVNNPGRHTMEDYDDKGRLLQKWGTASNSIAGFCGCCNPIGFTVLRNGDIVTAEKGIPRVKIYGPTGVLLSVVAGPAQFSSPHAQPQVAVDKSGRILIFEPGSPKIRVFTKVTP